MNSRLAVPSMLLAILMGSSVLSVAQMAPVSFARAAVYDTGGYLAESVAVGDLNGDGKPDLVVANCGTSGTQSCANGTVSVLLGNGDGTFQPAVTYSSGGVSATSVALGDVNGDSKLDILVGNLNCSTCGINGGVGVLLGNGNGTFQSPTVVDAGGLFTD